MKKRNTHIRRLKKIEQEFSTSKTRAERLLARNKMIALRYWWYSERCHYSVSYTVELLSNREFFLNERTIMDVIVEMSSYLPELRAMSPSARQLSVSYPNFSWEA